MQSPIEQSVDEALARLLSRNSKENVEFCRGQLCEIEARIRDNIPPQEGISAYAQPNHITYCIGNIKTTVYGPRSGTGRDYLIEINDYLSALQVARKEVLVIAVKQVTKGIIPLDDSADYPTARSYIKLPSESLKLSKVSTSMLRPKVLTLLP